MVEKLICFNHLVSSTTKTWFHLGICGPRYIMAKIVTCPTMCLKDEIDFPSHEHRILCELSGKSKMFCSKKLI